MKLAIINKLPENSKSSINFAWNCVYIAKEFNREEAFQFVAGIISGLNHVSVITDDERRELFNYYKRWFSL